MNHALVLQNQALYLTTLHKRKEGWQRVRHYSYKLARASSQIIEHGALSETEKIALCAALYCLEYECTELDKVHGTKDE